MSKTEERTSDDDVDRAVTSVGPALRRARERRTLTLRQVEDRTGIGVSTLSRLESGHRKPTLELLLPLVRLYGVAIDDLVAAPPSGDPRVHPRVRRIDGGVYIALTHGAGPVQAVKMVLSSTAEEGPPQRHEGYEWLYVLSGVLRLEIDGERTDLAAGEAAEFDTRRAHSMVAVHGTTEVLGLFSANGEQVHAAARVALVPSTDDSRAEQGEGRPLSSR